MKKIILILILLFIALSGESFSTDKYGRYDSETPYNLSDQILPNYTSDLISLDTWWPANTFPSLPSGTYFQASAWLGDTLYVHVPSSTGAASTTIMRYTWNGSWSTGVPLPGPKVGGTLTACNGKLYYIGGGTSSILTGTNQVLDYNPSNGTWTTKANMPALLAAHGAECWGDSVIFVWGGPYSGSATNLSVHYYRVGSDSWGTVTNSIPSGQGRRTFAHGIMGNKLYMGCGYNTAYLSSFYHATIGSNASQLTWTMGPIAPGVALSRPGGWAGYGRFYIVAGEMSGGGYSTNTLKYDTTAGTWSQISGKPNGCSNIFSGVAGKNINDTVRVCVPGGYNVTAFAFFDVMQANYSPIVGIIHTGEIATQYYLSQNYPNPFNPGTRINFAIPKSENVEISITDITGRNVGVILNEFKASGTYTVDFDASKLSSGVYFYTITAGDFRATKKMLLVK